MSTSHETSKVLVYRRNVDVASETFIRRQVASYSDYSPTVVGYSDLAQPWWPEFRRLGPVRDADRWRHNVIPLRLAIQDLQPNVVHAHFGLDAIDVLRAVPNEIPLVTTFHGFDVSTSASAFLKSRNAAAVRYLRFRGELARRGSLFICVSEAVKDQALRLGFPESRTVTHHIGIDAAAIEFVSTRTDPIVLHVARLVEKKGTADLIRAFQMLSERVPNAVLRIAGDGPLRGQLVEIVKLLGLSKKVVFLGEIPNDLIFNEMSRAAVLCQPSKAARSGDREGLPTVLMEAMAVGTPILATRHAGNHELIDDGLSGVLVDEGNPRDLGAALIRLMEDPLTRSEYALAARRRILAHFDIRDQTHRLENLYSNISGRAE